MKKIMSLLLVALFVSANTMVAHASRPVERPDIKINIGGQYINSDIPVIVINNRALVPLRTVADGFNTQISWNANARTVYLYIYGPTSGIVLYTNNPLIRTFDTYRGVKDYSRADVLEVGATIINNRTYIPLRFFAEELGYAIHWCSDKYIYISRLQ